jgi:hypothetical protein
MSAGRLRELLAGVYAWIAAVFVGATFLDVMYAGALPKVLDPARSAAIFSDVADALLLVGFAAALAAVGAIAAAWTRPAARNLLIISLLVFGLEFAAPAVMSSLVRIAEAAVIGPWLRILPVGLASILASAAVFELARVKEA